MPAIDFPALAERPASREVSGAFTPPGPVVFTPDAARLADSATKGHGPLPSSAIQVAPNRTSHPGSMTKVAPPASMLPEITAPAPAVTDQSRSELPGDRRGHAALDERRGDVAEAQLRRQPAVSGRHPPDRRRRACASPTGPPPSSASHTLLAMTVGPTGAETPQPKASSGKASASAAAPRSAAVRAGATRTPT